MTDAIKVTYSISFSVTPQCQRKVCNSHIGGFCSSIFNASFNYDLRIFQCMQEEMIGKKKIKGGKKKQ